MKKYLYILAGILAFGVTSCKDEVEEFNPATDLDRMPMTMFRQEDNTNVSTSADPYGTRLKDETRNTVQLYWYGVEGAAGYEIRYGVQGPLTHGRESDWSNPELITDRFIVGPDVLHYEIPNLNYSTVYRFQIRVLNPDGIEEHHSRWWGMGAGQEWEDYCDVPTSARYVTPGVLFASDKDFNSFNVYIDLTDKTSSMSQADQDTIHARFEVADGKYVAQTLYLQPDAANPEAHVPFSTYELKPEDLERGYIHIDGLDENSTYVVRLRNNNIPVEVDSYYNDVTMRTKGTPGGPITIEHRITDKIYPDSTWNVGERKYNCMLLDTLITSFNASPKLAEGQVFYLQGDKAYYFWNNIDLNKGFTMETDPADVLLGKRAIVYMAGIAPSQGTDATKTCNFMFGKNLGAGEVDAPVQVENVIFRNIDFDVPEALNFGGAGSSSSGNYFANMYSTGRGVTFDKIEFDGCTFQGFIRGFIRTQGSKVKKFKELIVNNCVFHNCGYFRTNAGGYSWFAGELSSPENNIFQKFRFTNSTIYDCPMSDFMTHGTNQNYDEWDADHHYDITIENNTFINFCTRARKTFFSFRSLPGGTKISFRRNLIVLAAADDDERGLDNGGSDVRYIGGSGEAIFDFADNYSAGCRETHLKDNGIFSGQPFSATSNSFGKYKDYLVSGYDELSVKVGSDPLKATDLFVNPNPTYKQKAGENNDLDHRSTQDIYQRLQYKTDIRVTSHEIYTKNIGDQRWKSSDPKHFSPTGWAE